MKRSPRPEWSADFHFLLMREKHRGGYFTIIFVTWAPALRM